ncbi:MAG: lysylphosphatidylglycerol synthase transmembrane domain-containing protein [Candidatus Aminicenantales bacterium]
MMKKTWFRLSLIFLLTAVFLFFFFRSVEWKEVFRYLSDVNLPVFIVLLVLSPLHLATRALRWKYLLIHEKKNVRFFNLFAGNTVGFTVTFIFPGRLGELVKPLYLARKEKIRSGYVIGTVVVERIFDMFTMCFLLGIFLLVKPLYSSFFKVTAEFYSDLYLWGIIGVGVASILLAVSLLSYFFRERALTFVSLLLRPFPDKISKKILHLFHEFIDGLKFFHSVGNLLVYILLSFVVWLGIILYYWIFFFAYHISTPYFTLVPYVFLTMIGASIPTPGMVGGFHYFSKVGLTSLFNVDPNLAVGMTIVVHAIQLTVTCILGYVILWKEGLTLFQLKKLGESIEP